MNRRVEPDCIIMDINMPVLDGLEATRRIMQDRPVPILILSNVVDADSSYRAISNGAVDVLRKPDIDQFNEPEFYQGFLQRIRSLSAKKVTRPAIEPVKPLHTGVSTQKYGVVVIGASTGGPAAVRHVLQQLPGNFPVGIVLVQHLEQGFEQGYARWLDEATALQVRLVEQSEKLTPGAVLVAPVEKHVILHGQTVMLDDGPRVLNQKPSVDVLFTSAVKAFRDRVLGVLLTGMGYDGANGCAAIVAHGGTTLVQDKDTSAIFGMPKAAIDAGAASRVLPLQAIAACLVELVS